jgi:hypothetical protein
MNLNLSYQYVSVIFNILKEKNDQLNNISEHKRLQSSSESRLELLIKNGKYSGNKLNKKILNNQKIIRDNKASIDDLNNYLENIVNVRLMFYLRKLYYINNNFFNQGVFILESSLSLDTKIEDEKIASDNSKFKK